MDKDKIDFVKISEKYGNNVKQLANWVKSLTNTDYGYKYLKKEGYSEEQIGDWVRRTPPEKPKNPKKKSSTVNLGEELLREGVKTEDVTEEERKTEDEELQIPKPEGNKGTVSSNSSLRRSSTFDSSVSGVNALLRNSSPQSSVEENSSPGLRLEDLSPQQLTALGMMRDGNGAFFHVSDTEDGGYRLTPATQESLAGAVAGVQRQAQRSQRQTQQNEQDTFMQKISEKAVDQFQVNIQAIVRKVALSPTVHMGFAYIQSICQVPAGWDVGDFLNHRYVTMANRYGARLDMSSVRTDVIVLARTL